MAEAAPAPVILRLAPEGATEYPPLLPAPGRGLAAPPPLATGPPLLA